MSEIFYAGFIPFYLDTCTQGTLIYRIDDPVGAGDTVPNLGSAVGADLTIFEVGPSQLLATTPGTFVCDFTLPWTALIRVGAFTGGPSGTSFGGGFVAIGGAQPDIFHYGEAYSFGSGDTTKTVSGPASSVDVDATQISDTVFMTSYNPPAPGNNVVDYRVVSIVGGVVTDYPSLTPMLYDPGVGALVATISADNITINQAITGLGVWREYITTDAEFLAKLAEFLAA